MADTGVIFKRCGCRNDANRRLERACPRLSERGHGSWYFHCSATNLLGRPERARRGGYRSQAAARRARDEWLATTGEDRTARSWTVERWLRYWLSSRTSIRPTTKLHYTRDVERVLIPHLGRLCLADLDARRLRTIFTEIAQTTNTKGQPQSASAMQHLRTTLRAALNLAVREGVIATNPARHIEVPSYRKPHAKVWTDGRVAEWQRTGERPSVAVWTADQLATFLHGVTNDALFALWWLTALRGLRRGEACGLRWSELDLDHGVLFVVRNRTTAGYQVVEGEPKTAAGRRAVALDRRTVKVLREHRRRQTQQRERRLAAGKVWHDSGYVFVGKEGNPIHPSYASGRFRLLVKRAGIPPVRLHDLRHGAASLAHEAGADLKTLQDLLGHSSIVITADTYTSVLPLAQRKCADATAKLVLAADRRTREKIRGKSRRNRRHQRPAKGVPTPARPANDKKPQVTPPTTGTASRTVTTPPSHPRDTHRPQRTETTRGLNRIPAGQASDDLARPKGLEPLTF
ncbi:tyrosine-type recombinase/integrase [Dactylosporangium vinaceum]|uniref:Tyrosine-type recombinase/integrase n=1 Tax=Dactylosporangium vinaceum TaxID=53362 RepID=A0ABV5M2D4_9ACTN|nr:tyrosine-type recombinase/integrase [Dactylosporangium vinaceum]UAB96242.1 tyrosine-type recombinase/integrase [Dactylosporangium vinaceum]